MENKGKRGSVTTILGIIAGIGGYYLVTLLFNRNPTDLRAVVNGMNKKCPIMVDRETRLDNTLDLNASTPDEYISIAGKGI